MYNTETETVISTQEKFSNYHCIIVIIQWGSKPMHFVAKRKFDNETWNFVKLTFDLPRCSIAAQWVELGNYVGTNASKRKQTT